MGYLEKNEINIFNDIVYQIYSIKDLDEMRLNFLKAVRLLIAYESCNFFLAADESNHYIAHPVHVNFPIEALSDYLENIEGEDPTRWIFIQGKSMVYRENDMFSKEAIEANKCYKDFYIPHNLHHSTQISLAKNGEFLGSLSYYRKKAQEPFSDKDLFLFTLLKDHLELRLYQERISDNINAAGLQLKCDLKKFNLTERESELTDLLLKGLTVEDISDILCISNNTVRKHTMNIYKKMNISSRWELFSMIYL